MAKQYEFMSRRLPYCDTKRSVFLKRFIFGLKDEEGKRVKYKTTWSYWIGLFLWEFNLTIRYRPN